MLALVGDQMMNRGELIEMLHEMENITHHMWLKVMMSNYGCEAESSYDHYRMRNEIRENSAKLDSLMKVLNQELKVREEN